eukprot:s726_g30.t1
MRRSTSLLGWEMKSAASFCWTLQQTSMKRVMSKSLLRELDQPTHSVEIIPIINEALERRMFHFTMSERKIKTMSLAESYKLVRFVGHGILNRAKEGAKRGAKSPALAAGFQKPVEIDELDPEGKFVMELCGRKQTVRDLFQKFADMEKSLIDSLQRKVVVGLAHNDLHGGNLLVDSQGLVWLIDFATVKQDQHVLMDLTKFLSACTFMYLQEKVNEKHVQSLAKMMAVTPDATTDLPLAFLNDAQDDPLAIFFFRIISRLRYCMCIYESGPGSPANDGLPFAVALFSWSTRMLSYSEPSLYQKTRALYWSIAGLQRILWAIGHDVGPVATKWIEEKRELWEGQKGRRLSSSVATDKQAIAAYSFELELPTYLSQAGASEGWATDILTREKVNVMESSVPLTMKFDGRLDSRRHQLEDKAKILFDHLTPTLKSFAPCLFDMDIFCGRVLIVGDAGSGKSVLTKQIFAALAQNQVRAVQALADLPKVKDDQGRVVPPKLEVAFLPVRVPLVDWSRQLEKDPDNLDVLQADVMSDLLSCWLAQKYGEDSNLMMLVLDIRNASLADEETDASMGLVLLLDGLDEASSRRTMLLEYMGSLLVNEPNHFPILTSRPGVLAIPENEFMAARGFVSVTLSRLSNEDALVLSRRMMARLGDSEDLIGKVCNLINNPAYNTLTGNPLCLGLLTNVLRKTDLDSAKNKILDKVEVYARAFKLMLHQSDAAKFASRDGKSDQAMIKHLENLKGTDARKYFQSVAWQGQSNRLRAMTMEMLEEVSGNEELFSSFSVLLKQGRIPVFQKIDASGAEQYQLAHLSFQEMLAAEFCSGVVYFAKSKNQAREYLNFMLSNSSKTLERDRVADNWWLQVWLSVGKMLDSAEYETWCSFLASDERTWLTPGKRCFFGVKDAVRRAGILSKCQRPSEELDAEEIKMKGDGLVFFDVVYVDYQIQKAQLRARVDSWHERAAMKLDSVLIGGWSPIGYLFPYPVATSSVCFELQAVNVLMNEAVKLSQDKLVMDLVTKGVHFGILNKQFMTVANLALTQDNFEVASFLAEKQVDLDAGSYPHPVLAVSSRFRYMNPKSPDVQRPFASCMQLARLKPRLGAGVLRDCLEGCLVIKDDLDVNYLDPRTGISLLMLAAAGGHAELVAALLKKKSMVNAKTTESCTALSFALDCTNEDEQTLECVRLLLEAKADVTVKTGVTPVGPFLSYFFGTSLPIGFGVVLFKHERKMDLLDRFGYDWTMTSDMGWNASAPSLLFLREDDERGMRVFERIKKAGVSVLARIRPVKDYFTPVHSCSQTGKISLQCQIQMTDQRFLVNILHTSLPMVQKCVESGADINAQLQISEEQKRTLKKIYVNPAPWFVFAATSEPLMQLVGDMTVYNYLWNQGLNIAYVPGQQSQHALDPTATQEKTSLILTSSH